MDVEDCSQVADMLDAKFRDDPRAVRLRPARLCSEDDTVSASPEGQFKLDVRVIHHSLVSLAMALGWSMEDTNDAIRAARSMQVVVAISTGLYLRSDREGAVLAKRMAVVRAKGSFTGIDVVPAAICAAAAFRAKYMPTIDAASGRCRPVQLVVIDAGYTKTDAAFVDIDGSPLGDIVVIAAVGDSELGLHDGGDQYAGRVRDLVDQLFELKAVKDMSTASTAPRRVVLLIGGGSSTVRGTIDAFTQVWANEPLAPLADGEAELLVAEGAAILCRDAYQRRLEGHVRFTGLLLSGGTTMLPPPPPSSFLEIDVGSMDVKEMRRGVISRAHNGSVKGISSKGTETATAAAALVDLNIDVQSLWGRGDLTDEFIDHLRKRGHGNVRRTVKDRYYGYVLVDAPKMRGGAKRMREDSDEEQDEGEEEDDE